MRRFDAITRQEAGLIEKSVKKMVIIYRLGDWNRSRKIKKDRTMRDRKISVDFSLNVLALDCYIMSKNQEMSKKSVLE